MRFERMLARFCDYPKKLDIPRIWLNIFDTLTVECDADKLRVQPVATRSKERKRAVEVTAAHTNPVARCIEGDQGCDDDIESIRVDEVALSRFEQVVPVAYEVRVGGYCAEPHGAFVAQNRRGKLFSHRKCARDDRPGVDLLVARQVAGDLPSTAKKTRPHDGIANAFGSRRTHGYRQSGSGASTFPAQNILFAVGS